MPGRRRGPGGRNAAAGQSSEPGQQAPGSSLFVPGYSGERPASDTGRQAAVLASDGWHGAITGTATKGPVRGFPPAPGQPPPVYPPGQFSAWNRTARPPADSVAGSRRPGRGGQGATDYPGSGSDDSAWPWPPESGYADPGYARPGDDRLGDDSPGYDSPGYGEPGQGEPGYADPGYSVLAVSDPAADVTATQSWKVVDASPATSGWTDPRALAAPPRAGRAAAGMDGLADGEPSGQAEHPADGPADLAERADTGRTGRARSDTGSHRAKPGSASPGGGTNRLPVPPARRPAPTSGGPTSRQPGARTPGRAAPSGRAGWCWPADWCWPW